MKQPYNLSYSANGTKNLSLLGSVKDKANRYLQQRSIFQHLLRILLYSVLLFMALIYLLPLLVMVMNSLKDVEEIRNGSLLALPKDPSLAAWSKAWGSEQARIERWPMDAARCTSATEASTSQKGMAATGTRRFESALHHSTRKSL